MTREEAINVVKERLNYYESEKRLRSACELLIPELRESEDEKIRKRLVEYFEGFKMGNAEVKWEGLVVQEVLAWLEKQKENPKTADSIPADCASNAKCEDRGEIPQEFIDFLGARYQSMDTYYSDCSALAKMDAPSLWAIAAKYFKEVNPPAPYDDEKQKESEDKGEISDGYHTFNELYYYRMLYNAAFFNLLPKEWVHKSKRHHDGEECFGGGWFIVMANLPSGQVSNHYELKDWDLFQIPEKEIADEWDGHTPQEAAERIHKYLLEKQKDQRLSTEETELNSIAFLEELGYTCIPPHSLAGCVDDKMVLKKLEASAKEYYKRNYEGENPQGKGVVIQSYIDGASEWLEQKEQKPEWSEEDERMLSDISWAIRYCAYDDKRKELVHDWFQSHLTCIKPHWKPSEEQKRKEAWLKSLRPQSQRAWNENDEKMLKDIIESLRRYQLSMPNSLVELQMRWLRSLLYQQNAPLTYRQLVTDITNAIPKDVTIRRWKPSEEQMKHLERCFSHGHTSQLPNQHVLESLYNDLKKL